MLNGFGLKNFVIVEIWHCLSRLCLGRGEILVHTIGDSTDENEDGVDADASARLVGTASSLGGGLADVGGRITGLERRMLDNEEEW